MEALYRSRHSVRNAFDKAERVKMGHRSRGLTQDTRATVDGVLDPRTMLILRKFRSAGHMDELGGTISTGKEANVYAAVGRVRMPSGGAGGGSGGETTTLTTTATPLTSSLVTTARAIKIFKTSILTFKNRRQYVEGEHRFRHGYQSCANPRKMVKQWAEKEFRNLRRMYQAGVRGPLPICLRGHAFIMSMIGKDDQTPAPRLKDYPALDLREWKRLYIECLSLARTLYQKCQLVHGDLSEYNILFHQGHPYIIDVSQATDDAHCHAERFLKRDCMNLSNFFSRKCQGLPDEEEEVSDEERSEVESEFSEQSQDGEEERGEAGDSVLSSDAEASDASASETSGPTCKVRFKGDGREEDFLERVRGPSALNRWKWDASLAEKNAWNELEKIMDCETLKKLDQLEVLNAENTFKYITAEKLIEGSGSQFDENDWPIFDEKLREDQWRVFSIGQRILNNRSVPEDADREVVEEKKQLNIPLEELQSSSRSFRSVCAETLEFISNHRGQNNQDNTAIFMQSLAPQSLHELATIEVEHELKKIQKGQPSKYADLVARDMKLRHEAISEESDEEEEEERQMNLVNSAAEVDDSDAGSACSTDTPKRKFDGNIPAGIDPKEWKKKVKSENRERRLHKLKKKDKKQKIKRSARR